MPSSLDERGPPPFGTPDRERLRVVAEADFSFIWRSLRRLGVPTDSVDDAAQQVFEVAARRLADIEPGHERAFLFKTALWIAVEARRSAARRRGIDGGDALAHFEDPGPSPEEAAERRRQRALLDRVLDGLPIETRAVFVLFELEELPGAEIARLLEIPPGTVASRLRRAREEFHAEAKRLRARLGFRGELR